MNVKVMVAALSAVAAVTGFAADNVVENKFKTTLSSNTPLTAYDWSSPALWQDEAKGAPFGWGAKATMPTELPLECFYTFPEGGLKLSYLQIKRGHYLGDVYTSEFPDGTRDTFQMDSYLPAGADLYGNYHPTFRGTNPSYLSGVQVAGRIIPGFEAPATKVSFALTGLVQIRHDLFAESSDPVREGVVYGFAQYQHTMNGSLAIVGPKGAAALNQNWKQTAGSAFIQYSSNAHGVVPGMKVTGDGVPAGTFVRYVFPRSTWVALSASIEEGKTKSSNALHFEAITPSVSESYPEVIAGADDPTRFILISRYRESDAATLTIGEYNDYAGNPSGSASSGCAWGIPNDAARYPSMIPGDIVINKFGMNGASYRRIYTLNAVRLTFNCDVGEVTANPDYQWCQTYAAESRVTVADGKTVHFSNFHDLLGTIDKRGAGKLVLPLKNTVLTGTVKVAAGEFEFRKTSAVAADAVLHLGRLELSSGAVLTVPPAGMTVDTFVSGAGAIVKGGPLTVNTDGFSTMPVLSVTDGGSFVTTRRPLTREAAVPSADRWLHLDASDASTLVTEKEGDKERVVRWNDVSGGAVNARPYAVPGFTNGSIYLTDACNGLQAVDLGTVSWGAYGTTDGTLSGDGKTRVLFFYDGDTRFTEQGRADCKVNTAFFMVGSQGGGGTLLNSSGNFYYAKGLPHTGNPEKNWIISAESTAGYWNYFSRSKIDAGTILFRQNGVKAYPNEQKFSGGWDVFAYRAGGDVVDRQTCGFGMTANGDGRASYAYDHTYGGLAYGEVILYTNFLDAAQVDYVEAYLMKKWKNVDTEGFGPLKVGTLTLDAASSVSVSGDKVIAANVTGAGTVNAGLEISEGAALTASIGSDGQVGTLSVAGKLELPTVATLAFAGSAKPKRGVHVLYSAETLVGDISGWTVTVYPGDRGIYRLFVEDNKVKLEISAPGLSLLFR